MNGEIDYADFPPAALENMRYVPVVTVKKGRPLQATIVNAGLRGLYVHWDEGRSYPCKAGGPNCVSCNRGVARRWKGYLGCWFPQWSRYGIVEITVNAVRTCPALINQARNLRGLNLRLERVGKSTNSPVKAELSTLPMSLMETPASFDVEPHLHQLFFGGEGILPRSRKHWDLE